MIAISVPDVMLPGDSGGYRWVVAIAAFFTQFIICGITYSIGVFHIVFSKIFNEDHFNTSWIGSILLYSTALTSKWILNFLKFDKNDLSQKIQWAKFNDLLCNRNSHNEYALICIQKFARALEHVLALSWEISQYIYTITRCSVQNHS